MIIEILIDLKTKYKEGLRRSEDTLFNSQKMVRFLLDAIGDTTFIEGVLLN